MKNVYSFVKMCLPILFVRNTRDEGIHYAWITLRFKISCSLRYLCTNEACTKKIEPYGIFHNLFWSYEIV